LSSKSQCSLLEDRLTAGPEKATEVRDTAPPPKSESKYAKTTACKVDRFEVIIGSSYKAALEIKDTIKSKSKGRAKKALSLDKSPKTRQRNTVPENLSRYDDNEIFCIYCENKYGLKQENWIWAHEDCTDMRNQLRQFTRDVCRNLCVISVEFVMR
jgi:hypothetical protein